MNAYLRLSDLNSSIKELIGQHYDENLWIVAEISELNVNRNGHAYLELVEKDEASNKLTAKINATIWSYTFRVLKPYFETTTGYQLTQGVKILFNASVEFHEVYGISLNVRDIDPVYTLGDIEKKRQETLRKLEEEGVLLMNRELSVSDLPQKIAVISSPTAAGYQDFINQLSENEHKFVVYTKLFPAIMQGEKAEEAIVDALERIFRYEHFFDLVVIIRGGGSQSDLSCFDSYWLALNIAQFPLPVFTGIGHEKDTTIADLVAHTKLKTPTAVAEYLLNKFEKKEQELTYLQSAFLSETKDFLKNKKMHLQKLSIEFLPSVSSSLSMLKHQLEMLGKGFGSETRKLLEKKQHGLKDLRRELYHKNEKKLNEEKRRLIDFFKFYTHCIRNGISKSKFMLEKFETTSRLMNPDRILKMGYSIVYQDEKLIKNKKDIDMQKNLTIKLYKGQVEAKIVK